MRLGTIRVRELLHGENAATVTDKQIQEALWHYYYDVDKSVAYITSTYIDKAAKASKKKKPAGKSGDGSMTGGFTTIYGPFFSCTLCTHGERGP